MFTVYIIKSNTKLIYTGHTNNLSRRLLEHNTGLCKSTKNGSHWMVIYSKDFQTRSEAMKYEKWLKSGTGREFIDEMMNSNENT